MRKETRKSFCIAVGFLAVFAVWTLLLRFVDVKEIGPQGSAVGFATLNGYIHGLTGSNMSLYTLTDWLGLVPVAVCAGFAVLGIVQWIKRKSVRAVDYSILVLGGFYIVVMALYILFEMVVINYRPILIEGFLEVSYPSSTTMLVLCVMPTAIMQADSRIKSKVFRNIVVGTIIIFTAFMVIGRLVSGVHWFTDIVGGILLSAGLVMMYRSVCSLKNQTCR